MSPKIRAETSPEPNATASDRLSTEANASTGGGPTLTREQTLSAYQRHTVVRGGTRLSGDAWSELADLFAVDGRYYDSWYGWTEGREAIRAFLRRAMTGLDEWRFPTEWVEVGEGRVVVHLRNVLPGARRDGSAYEFPSFSAMTYNSDGLIQTQKDVYDTLLAMKLVGASRLSTLMGRRRSALP